MALEPFTFTLLRLQARVARIDDKVFEPVPANHEVYKQLYALYSELHDTFGMPDGALSHVMKDLIAIRDDSGGAA